MNSRLIGRDSQRFRISARDVFFIFVAMAAAFVLRFDFMRGAHYVIDGDEAIVGLMAKHILSGERIPTFYYGQSYMGSLEAIFAAGAFAMFGISGFVLQCVPLAFGLILVPLVFLLGRECSGRTSAWIATALTAVPPVGLLLWSAKARGGFIEIVVIGAVVLLLTSWYLRSRALNQSLPGWIGLYGGLGWWVNNQIVYFLIPAGCAIAIHLFQGLIDEHFSARAWRGVLRIVSIGLVAFFVGGSPYWAYNITHNFPSLGMFHLATWEEMGDHFDGLISTALPILIGSMHFWESKPILPNSIAMYSSVYISLIVIAFVMSLRARRIGTRGEGLRREVVFLLVGFLLVSCIVFSISTFGWLVQAPRYLLPMYVGLFVLLGAGIECIARLSQLLAASVAIAMLGLNLISGYYPKQAVPGEPVVFAGERVARDHHPIISRLKALGITTIRTNYWIGYRLAFETNEEITFSMFQAPHQIRIPRYEEKISEAERNELPLVVVSSETPLVRSALKMSGYRFVDERVGEYTLFRDLEAPSNTLSEVPREQLSGIASTNAYSPSLAIDGDASSRWGTGIHQQPGQTFTISFVKPVPISSLQYDLGIWVQDFPRGLEVTADLADGTRARLLSPADYQGLRYFCSENHGFRIFFPSVEAKAVTFSQTGNDPVFDWSIAELHFFTGM